MAYLVGKKQGGKTYYYLTESARVNGKPRIVSQQYLGSADEIAQRLSEAGPGEPDRSPHLGFGDIAAVWGMLERLGVVGIIDDVVGSRRSDAAASVGTYIALAALNRVVAPCSKLAFADWWAKTAGDRLVGHLSSGCARPPEILGRHGRHHPDAAHRDRTPHHQSHGADPSISTSRGSSST